MLDPGLAVVGAEHDRIALDEGIRPAGDLHQRGDRVVGVRELACGAFRAERVRRVVVVREVEDEEVEAVAGDQPAADRGRVLVDRARRTAPDGERRAGHVRLEQVVEEEASRPADGAVHPGQGCAVLGSAAIAGEVDRGGDEIRVVERLEDGGRLGGEMSRAQVEDRVDEGAARSGGDDRTERRAVLDDTALVAIEPDEMRDVVDVRMGARRDRRDTDGREGREGRGRPGVAAVPGEEGERRRLLGLDRPLEHRRRQAVDDDEHEAAHVSPSRGCAGRRSDCSRGGSP